jgi:hypothetical protein
VDGGRNGSTGCKLPACLVTGTKGDDMRKLPTVDSLQDAVKKVIQSNSNDGYVPARFIQATENGNAGDLLSICESLITKGETLEYLESALKRYTKLLTVEDFVSRFGAEWGFDSSTVRLATERAKYFDLLVGGERYN